MEILDVHQGTFTTDMALALRACSTYLPRGLLFHKSPVAPLCLVRMIVRCFLWETTQLTLLEADFPIGTETEPWKDGNAIFLKGREWCNLDHS